jgi:hypothetical protein
MRVTARLLRTAFRGASGDTAEEREQSEAEEEAGFRVLARFFHIVDAYAEASRKK